ncbi:MAG: undecaprenyldiphospho-muramoylpentapeptide beta-N-acetylglucosaminyltransferase [Bacteroidales bacterium]|nr:undecaprenyldiphospho-muramoylpentapeptide beta-N-acetylglucosaminyltransferase [Bacteroidales bacterium]
MTNLNFNKPKIGFLISGGGTGGHIFPAIAIAEELKKRFVDCRIHFVGAKGKMEMSKIPQAGYEIDGLWISGIQRSLTLKNLLFPVKILSSLWNARKIIRKFKPDVVIGTGGYASGPTLRMAQSMGLPTLVQEQNSFPGITNKWLASRVNAICVAYENMEKYFPKEKIRITGNPIRNQVVQIEGKHDSACKFFDLKEEKLTVLLVGGSQGALSINKNIEQIIDIFEQLDIQFIWQTGVSYYEQAVNLTKDKSHIKVYDFIYEMDKAYAAADIVLSRAGAIAISEICAVAKPSIFIPLPTAAEDHQTKNALALVEKDAAVLVNDKAPSGELSREIKRLVGDEELRNQLSVNMAKLAVLNSASLIVDEIEKLIKA